MKRQLRMGGGIMDIVPREQALLGGVKRAVKKVTKGVKDIVSSDVGKAALLAAAGAYAGGLGPFSSTGKLANIRGAGFARGLLNPFTGVVDYTTPTRSFFSDIGTGISRSLTAPGSILKKITGTDKGSGLLTKGLALAGLSTFLTSQYGLSEEEQEEELRDPEKLKSYLRVYYTNLNPNAGSEEIEEFVRVNSAKGGRIGFDEGSEDPAYMQDFSFSEQEKAEEFLRLLEDAKRDEENERMRRLQELYKRFILTRQPMEVAEGGRIGFDKGAPSGGVKGISSLEEEMVVIIQYDEDGNPVLKQVPKSEVMPEGILDSLDKKDVVIPIDKEEVLEGIIPRDNKAKGDSASMNAMQAAGVEGLPIRQNPKGVKELDLRKTGGFIPPVGIKEKADDIPAMLSNNEFVFTADAVRGAGGGNVNLGAQRMYDTMKRLEAGGKA